MIGIVGSLVSVYLAFGGLDEWRFNEEERIMEFYENRLCVSEDYLTCRHSNIRAYENHLSYIHIAVVAIPATIALLSLAFIWYGIKKPHDPSSQPTTTPKDKTALLRQELTELTALKQSGKITNEEYLSMRRDLYYLD